MQTIFITRIWEFPQSRNIILRTFCVFVPQQLRSAMLNVLRNKLLRLKSRTFPPQIPANCYGLLRFVFATRSAALSRRLLTGYQVEQSESLNFFSFQSRFNDDDLLPRSCVAGIFSRIIICLLIISFGFSKFRLENEWALERHFGLTFL